MDDKSRIAELEKALQDAQKRNKNLEERLNRQKTMVKEARAELKKNELMSKMFSERGTEVISTVFPDIDITKLP